MYNCHCCATERMFYMEILDEKTGFEQWAKKWYLHKSIGISAGYRVALESQVKHLINYFGDTSVCQIKPIHMYDLIEQLAINNPHTNKPSSKQLLKDIKSVATNIFDYICDNTDYEHNPARRIKIPKNAPQNVRRPLTNEEISWIISMPHRARLSALIMTFCGLRAGELIPLQWSDIDFENAHLHITKSVVRTSSNIYSIKQGTKNGKSRIIVIPDSILEELVQYKAISKSRFISSKLDDTMHTPSSWKKLWESYNNQLSHNYATFEQAQQSIHNPTGITKRVEKITPHMFRHTYATLLYTSGVDVLSASKLLGHSDVSITLKVYTHLQETRYQISIDKLDKFIENFFK